MKIPAYDEGGRLMLTEFRCCECNKLLGKIKGEAEIKCPRCNNLNYVEGLKGHINVYTVKQVKLFVASKTSC